VAARFANTHHEDTPMNFDDSPFFATWTPRAQALLRIVSGYLFLLHGSAKLLGMPQLDMPSPPLLSLFGMAGVIEIGGGVLLVLGLFTRPAAFVMSGEMAVAYFMAHASQGSPLVPLRNMGESAVLFCFVFLYLFFAGAGAWSLDGLRAKRSG
jgi:putative oxidoreductase